MGVAKGVNIIPVKYLLPDNTLGLSTSTKSSPMSVFESLQWVLWHVVKTEKQGQAVLTVPQGKSCTILLRHHFQVYKP